MVFGAFSRMQHATLVSRIRLENRKKELSLQRNPFGRGKRRVCGSGGHAMANGGVVALGPERLEIRGRPRSLGERHHMSIKLQQRQALTPIQHLCWWSLHLAIQSLNPL
jgi:hypothetical protein